jgi:hypothetical protein
MVTFIAADPAVMLAGEREVTAGRELSMTTWLLEEPEFCPSGFATVMVKLPPLAASTAVTAAFNVVALMKVVTNGVPFQDTTLPLTKPLPLICRLNAAELAGTVAGETPAIAGGDAAGVEGVLGDAGLVVPAGDPPPQPMKYGDETIAIAVRSARNQREPIRP